MGASASQTGLSQVEPQEGLAGFATSIPSAWSFCGTDGESLEGRAIALVMSMVAVKCKNMYPKGVFGHEARAHYDEARHIAAQGMSAGTAETLQGAQVEDRQPGPQDAPVSPPNLTSQSERTLALDGWC